MERTETRKATALKTSHLKDLTEDKAKLFQVLSTKNYDEKIPKMNDDASALTSNRTLDSIENRLSDWQENWPGTNNRSSTSSQSQFLIHDTNVHD